MIGDEGVTELDGNAAGIVELRSADCRGNFGREGIIEVDDNKRFVSEDISKCSGDSDSMRAGQDAARIERESALQEIVGGIAIKERAHAGTLRFEIRIADDDEPFFSVRNVKETVEQVDGLLLVFGQLLPQWIDAKCRWRGNGNCIFRWNVEALADGRDRGGGDFLRKVLVVDVGDVVDAQATRTESRVCVFTTSLDVEDI